VTKKQPDSVDATSVASDKQNSTKNFATSSQPQKNKKPGNGPNTTNSFAAFAND